jgi:hypothetical protein
VGINGVIGSGKTLTMTYFAYQAHKKGAKVLSNYGLNFPHTLITSTDILNYADEHSQLKDCFLAIDEMHIFLDCRKSSKNTALTYMILQSRKRGVNIYWTSQHFRQVDLRLRNNTDLAVECHPVKVDKALKAIKLDFQKCLGSDVMQKIRTIFINNPEQLFKLYDTYEIVKF